MLDLPRRQPVGRQRSRTQPQVFLVRWRQEDVLVADASAVADLLARVLRAMQANPSFYACDDAGSVVHQETRELCRRHSMPEFLPAIPDQQAQARCCWVELVL